MYEERVGRCMCVKRGRSGVDVCVRSWRRRYFCYGGSYNIEGVDVTATVQYLTYLKHQ